MAKYTFKADLSVKGIEKLKKDLINYKVNILPQKINNAIMELGKAGFKVASAKIDEAPLGKYVTLRLDTPNINTVVLVATGEVKQSEGFEDFNTLLAIEFGAGIYHNKTPNPNADKFGLGVGTFPGQIHAFEDGWYYWDEKDEMWKYTHGVKATMPMYSAQTAMIVEAVKIVQKSFRKKG